MKRLITYFTLLCFMIASGMQSIHAMDMGDMNMGSANVHRNMVHMTMLNESIFCNSDPIKQNQNDCYKEIIQDKGLNTQSKQELKTDKKISYPQLDYINSGNLNVFNLNSKNNFPPLDKLKLNSNYINLIGIVKNLN